MSRKYGCAKMIPPDTMIHIEYDKPCKICDGQTFFYERANLYHDKEMRKCVACSQNED